MPSQFNRGQIVQEALRLAGRGQELRESAENWLNMMLGAWALNNRYKELRKVGSEITLLAGASTAALPADFGAGSERLEFGSDRMPIYELTAAEFMDAGGLRSASIGTGRPMKYMIDDQAGVFRFDRRADQNYGFIPVYFYLPAAIGNGGSYDTQKVWHPSDMVVVQGLVEYIYQFNGDDREFAQGQRVEKQKGEHLRGTTPIGGGSSRVTLSPKRFRRGPNR